MARERNEDVLYIRVPISMRERVEEHRLAMQRNAPVGVEITRSAAIRNLLECALVSAPSSEVAA